MSNQTASRIGPSMSITGEVECDGLLIVEGSLQGTFSGNRLVISETGRLEGEIKADVIDCFGRLSGNVVTRSLKLKSSGSQDGIVEACELHVEQGAELNCVLHSGLSAPR
jgi:cytoskeletal protein CcmA (bactofilin family)